MLLASFPAATFVSKNLTTKKLEVEEVVGNLKRMHVMLKSVVSCVTSLEAERCLDLTKSVSLKIRFFKSISSSALLLCRS